MYTTSRTRRRVRQSLLLSMAGSQKKVIARRWDHSWLSGYLPAASFVNAGLIELLDLGGRVLTTPLSDLKWICFVRDFNSGEIDNPERLLRKTFLGRPRTAGLWVRVHLKDEDILEGIADNDLTLVTASGLFLTPPDMRSNTQRVFLPTPAITALEVLSVIGVLSKASIQPKPARRIDDTQADLF